MLLAPIGALDALAPRVQVDRRDSSYRPQPLEQPHEDEDQSGVLIARLEVRLIAVVADGEATVVESAAEVEPFLFRSGGERSVEVITERILPG